MDFVRDHKILRFTAHEYEKNIVSIYLKIYGKQPYNRSGDSFSQIVPWETMEVPYQVRHQFAIITGWWNRV
jgi:hypothetical protein